MPSESRRRTKTASQKCIREINSVQSTPQMAVSSVYIVRYRPSIEVCDYPLEN